MDIDTALYHSPKRKRGQISHGPSLVTSNLSHSLSSSTTTHHNSTEDLGSHSPSTRVTGKFQKLDLQSPIDLPTSFINNYTPTPEPTSETIEPEETKPTATNSTSPSSQEFKPPESIAFDFNFNANPPHGLGLGLTTPSPSSTTSPAASQQPLRTRSPPPSAVSSSQFWQASEITGWSPNDPDEDNYGVNGVGYAKTASKAWAISQKRKQQIADYRSRETRDARARRHERRRSGFGGGGVGGSGSGSRGSSRESPRLGGNGNGNGNGNGDRVNYQPERKGVRFVQFGDG